MRAVINRSMPELKKGLGLFEATVYGVGLILGAGIYAIIGEAAGQAGGSLAFSFAAAALIASLTGLSYAELSSMYPKAEGDYLYIKRAFENQKLCDLAALLRISVGVISAAAVSLAFAGYMKSFVSVPIIPVAILLIAVTSLVNFYGIDFSAKINILFTAIETLGLLLIIFMGVGTWPSVDLTHAPNGIVGILKSSFLIFFAYIGFESIVNVSEETEAASERIPKAIIVSIVFTTIIYILVGLSAVGLASWEALAESSSPLAMVAMEGWGPMAFTIISAIALFSTTNTVLIILISTSRIFYGVSKKQYHSLPDVFAKVHPKTRTPYLAIVAVMLLSMVFSLIGDVGIVAGLTNVFLLTVFLLVNASLLKIRYKKPDEKRGFKAPLNIGKFSVTAALGLVICLALVIFYIFQNFL